MKIIGRLFVSKCCSLQYIFDVLKLALKYDLKSVKSTTMQLLSRSFPLFSKDFTFDKGEINSKAISDADFLPSLLKFASALESIDDEVLMVFLPAVYLRIHVTWSVTEIADHPCDAIVSKRLILLRAGIQEDIALYHLDYFSIKCDSQDCTTARKALLKKVIYEMASGPLIYP